jgi:hypothetical protein
LGGQHISRPVTAGQREGIPIRISTRLVVCVALCLGAGLFCEALRLVACG